MDENSPALPSAVGRPPARGRSRLWLWFVAAFLIQLGAWTVWLTIAAKNPVQSVPVISTR